ncbi:hypothetical protein Bca4012_103062 [Brassica carinata]
MDVGNGLLTSFWYDAWSPLGCILDITGRRGVIDMGISLDCTVATVFQTHRRRRHHRVDILNRLEAEIENRARSRRRETEDVSLWRFKGDKFKNGFITKGTYNMLRQGTIEQLDWAKDIWFSHRTPKYTFLTWLSMKNRLSTGDRIESWQTGQRVDCVLCGHPQETRNHLFFECGYSSSLWHSLMSVFLDYTIVWDELLPLLHLREYTSLQLFLLGYTFQATIYHLWRKRNNRRHGEKAIPWARLALLIDKAIRIG